MFIVNALNSSVNFFYRCARGRRISRGYNYYRGFEVLRFYSNVVIVFVDELVEIFLSLRLLSTAAIRTDTATSKIFFFFGKSKLVIPRIYPSIVYKSFYNSTN